ncbi:hypothetical protein Efla_001384 [Eimeria flavescens]
MFSKKAVAEGGRDVGKRVQQLFLQKAVVGNQQVEAFLFNTKIRELAHGVASEFVAKGPSISRETVRHPGGALIGVGRRRFRVACDLISHASITCPDVGFDILSQGFGVAVGGSAAVVVSRASAVQPFAARRQNQSCPSPSRFQDLADLQGAGDDIPADRTGDLSSAAAATRDRNSAQRLTSALWGAHDLEH